VDVFTQNQVTFSRFLTFFRFSFQNLFFLSPFLPFFSRFQLTAVAAKNRSICVSMWKENQCFPKKFLPLSN